MKKYKISVLILIISISYSCKTQYSSSGEEGINVMAYYMPPRGNFNPEILPLGKLTHIIYSFTEVIDNEMKFRNDSSGIKLKMLAKQKKEHPHLKVMIACGGWSGSGGFSEMAKSAENREKFVKSVVRFIKKYKLDGLDIDWEYPGMRGIGNPFIPEDRENFTRLMCELRQGLDKISKDQVLTFAAAGWEEFFNHIEMDKVMNCVTFMNIMTYDNVTGGSSYTAHHTNLGWVKKQDIAGTPADLKMQEEGDTLGPASAEKIICFLTERGISISQLVIGGAFYGRAWKGVPSVNNGLYQLNNGAWPKPTRYFNIRDSLEDKNGFVRYWDTIAKAPYLYNAADSIFISYEDTVSIRLKARYAKDKGMGGIMFWQLAGDAKQDGLVDAIYAEKMKQ
ncbi:MAG: chitinase [Bacteroidales bacterium]|nr:chitinase [Bacteroidales bacterium]